LAIKKGHPLPTERKTEREGGRVVSFLLSHVLFCFVLLFWTFLLIKERRPQKIHPPHSHAHSTSEFRLGEKSKFGKIIIEAKKKN
jgi:hypothetical protein